VRASIKRDAKNPRRSLAPKKSTSSLAVAESARVFISYRRDPTEPAAAYLRHSLGRSLGEEKIFRDLDTLQPGQKFETAIGEAIRNTTVFLVLIGPSWLTMRGLTGDRRLTEKDDYVRIEIETALKAGVEIIPLLVDGAKMPSRRQLPGSIAELAGRNAYELPWAAGIAKLSDRILVLEKQREAREAADRAERQRLDLTEGQGVIPTELAKRASETFAVVARAMEISLARRGVKVWLSGPDIADSLKSHTNRSLESEGYLASELFYVIDFVGVKARASGRRYVARSYPLKSLDELSAHLALGRPVLASAMVRGSWFKSAIMKTGTIDFEPKEKVQGSVTCALVGWDQVHEVAKILLPWPTWGKSGMGTITRRALEAYIDRSELRSIEPVLMAAAPFTWKKT
jgi:TIR domain